MKLRVLSKKLYFKFKESTFRIKNGGGRIKYFYQNNSSDTLIIVFSGFSDVPNYQYVRTLSEFSVDKLFLLDDFGLRGTYYWYSKGSNYPEKLVMELLKQFMYTKKYKTIITAGSSKGGSCAIYYGLKIGATHIFAGACQYYIGQYLTGIERHIPIWVAMMGNEPNSSTIKLLDNKIKNVIKENESSRSFIHLLYGIQEESYIEHMKYMIEDFNEYNINYTISEAPFTLHDEIGKFFPEFLKKNINKLINN